MAENLNAKHLDWNSRLITTRGRLLRDYDSEYSCLIDGLDTPTTVPYNSSATPGVLDIVIPKDLGTQVFLTTCFALKSDQLPVLIETRCRSSFLNPPDLPELWRTDWSKFQASLEAGLPSNSGLPSEVAISACVKHLSRAISKALSESTPTVAPPA